MLNAEFQYYLKHQNELAKKYLNKFIVIKGEEVLGAYDSQLEAYDKSKEKHEVGSFLIQLCQLGQESHTQTYYTHRASF